MRRGLVEKLRLRCELAITVAFGAAQWVARWAARLPPPQPPAVQSLPFQDPLLRPLAGAVPPRSPSPQSAAMFVTTRQTGLTSTCIIFAAEGLFISPCSWGL